MAVDLLLPNQSLSLQDGEAQKGSNIRAQHFKSDLQIAEQIQPEKALMPNLLETVDKYLALIRAQKQNAVLQQASNTYKTEVDKLTKDYTAQKGANAVNNYESHVKSLNELQHKFSKTFDSEVLQQEFNKQIQTYALDAKLDSSNWHNKQVRQMYEDELKAGAEIAGENLASQMSSPNFEMNKDLFEKTQGEWITYNGKPKNSVAYASDMLKAYDTYVGKSIKNQIDIDPNMALANLSRVKDKISPNLYDELYAKANKEREENADRAQRRQLRQIEIEKNLLERDKLKREREAEKNSKPLDAKERAEIYQQETERYSKIHAQEDAEVTSYNKQIDETVKHLEETISQRAEQYKEQNLSQYTDKARKQMTKEQMALEDVKAQKQAQDDVKLFKEKNPYKTYKTKDQREAEILMSAIQKAQVIDNTKKLQTNEAFGLSQLADHQIYDLFKQGKLDLNDPQSLVSPKLYKAIASFYGGDLGKTNEFLVTRASNMQTNYYPLYQKLWGNKSVESYAEDWNDHVKREALIRENHLSFQTIAETNAKVEKFNQGMLDAKSEHYTKIVNSLAKDLTPSVFDIKFQELKTADGAIQTLFMQDCIKDVINNAVKGLKKGEMLTKEQVQAKVFAYIDSSKEFKNRKDKLKKFMQGNTECVQELSKDNMIRNETDDTWNRVAQEALKVRHKFFTEKGRAPSLEESIDLLLSEDAFRKDGEKLFVSEDKK